jgi:hypothetical protein
MEKFVDLGVSFFDEAFTLDPFPYLEELYGREEVLGFRSEGMNFVFRFEQARQVILSRACRREPLASPEIEAREKVYAERYPNRAKNFQRIYQSMDTGKPNFVIKKLLHEFLDDVSVRADFSGLGKIFSMLAATGRIDDYVESVRTLPLRVMLETCGLPFTEDQLEDLNLAGYEFLKALDNFVDESPLASADRAVARVWRYLEEHLEKADSEAPVSRLVAEGRRLGLDDESIRVNIGAFLIISLSNTAGISSAFLLRNLIRNPEARRQLSENPKLVEDDDVAMEFLRRDNHVKALSRQVHEDFDLGLFLMKKGESINIFFPGVNLDPAQWESPLEIDLTRRFTGMNNLIFGGSVYVCIGRKLGLEFMKKITAGFVQHLPEHASVVEDEIEVDGDWVAERIITKMPIVLGT